MKEIRFYAVNDPYGFFSNFSAHPILIAGEVWPTVEHFFQASKFEDYRIGDRIKSLESPMKAAVEGRNPKNILRADWETIKDQVMLKGLLAKFKQHPNLRKELLNTGTAVLIEHTKNDHYWGNGGDDTGKNMLGLLLMEARTMIYSVSSDPNLILPPWVAFAGLIPNDLFWRMGLGEGYMQEWWDFLESLNDKAKYLEAFPENDEWAGTYEELDA